MSILIKGMEMPPSDKALIMAYKDGRFLHPRFSGGESAVFASYFYFPACLWTDPVEEWEDYSGVTYWMSLPEPPKESDK